MIRCEARILREFKHKRAETVWPAYEGWDKLEVCGGTVTLEVVATEEPYMGGSDPKIEVNAKCTRCRAPYFPGAYIATGGSKVEVLLSRALAAYVEQWQNDPRRPNLEYSPGQHIKFEFEGNELEGRVAATPHDKPDLDMRKLLVQIEAVAPHRAAGPFRYLVIDVEDVRA